MKTETKHTPGMRCAIALQELGIAVTQETLALASFIDEKTAAPELLEALQRLIANGDVRDAAEKGAVTQANAAIAKATGETP